MSTDRWRRVAFGVAAGGLAFAAVFLLLNAVPRAARAQGAESSSAAAAR